MQWISNPDLRLNKLTWRRTNYILLHSRHEEWQFCLTLDNPADVATRPLAQTVSDRFQLWLPGSEFLTQTNNKTNTKAFFSSLGNFVWAKQI